MQQVQRIEVPPGAHGNEVACLVEELRKKTATREKLNLRLIQGSSGVDVLVQEQQLENSDLIDEHWTEVWDPEGLNKRRISVRCVREDMAVMLLVVAGDKAAGKTTFFAGLTGGSLNILQCFRYSKASFYNIWYSPTLAELQELVHAPNRVEPYFQTALAHGFMHLPMAEFDFFLSDEEFFSDGEDVPDIPMRANSAAKQDMMVKLLEIGGDLIQELMAMVSGANNEPKASGAPESARHSILHNVLQYLHQCTSMAYFINMDDVFAINGTSIKAVPDKLIRTIRQLQFLSQILPVDSHILFYCSREPDVTSLRTPWCKGLIQQISSVLAIETQQAPDTILASTLDQITYWEQNPRDALRHILQWSLDWMGNQQRWSISMRGFYPTQHLKAEGEFEYSNVLRTLHRLLKTGMCMEVNKLGLVAQQILNHAYNFWESEDTLFEPMTKDVLYSLLQEEEDGDVEDIMHPMACIPPMVLMDSFDEVYQFLIESGLGLGYHGTMRNVAIEFQVQGRSPLYWSESPQQEALSNALQGFRLPLHPTSKQMIRNIVDRMGSIDGLQGVLGCLVESDLMRAVNDVQKDVCKVFQNCVANVQTSTEQGLASTFEGFVWLLEEWFLIHTLHGKFLSQSPDPSMCLRVGEVKKSEWAAFVGKVALTTNPMNAAIRVGLTIPLEDE